MSIGTLITTLFFGKKVGTDEFGNKYYISSLKDAAGKNRRSVIYKGIPEASKVPPLWHCWLHYLTDNIPSDHNPYKWQKQHIPNLTGTNYAYFPSGHAFHGTHKADNSKYYQPWQPKN